MTDLDPKALLRSELAKFLPSQRAIRAFEKIFDLIPTDLNTVKSQVTDVSDTADSAMALGFQLAASLERLVNVLELISLGQPTMQGSEVEDLAPIPHLGTLATQNEDEIDVKGGNVTAVLTDSSTNLIASSQALSNGAGAAAGTLLNAPTVGNPTKWAAVDDNGTTRYIPMW